VIEETDPLDSKCDKRKLPWDKLKPSDKATTEKKQKSRKSGMTQNFRELDKTSVTVERSSLSLSSSVFAGEILFKDEMISPGKFR
jgi:hypothetical protein